MNKHQEAFDHILCEIRMCRRSPEKIEDLTKSLSLLQELVDKATPKKPNIENIHYICCPNCGSDEIELYDYYKDEVKLKHCNKCGQALDWSKDE